VWIDHRKAVVVSISGNGEEIQELRSDVEKQHGRFGGVRSVIPREAQNMAADDSQEREFTGELNVFYDAVLASTKDAESIVLLGPGEAKGELKKRFEKHHLAHLLAGVETADKMTVPQIAAKVRNFFLDRKTGKHHDG
jgi:hypothetical protein